MRTVLNLILDGFVLWAASRLFPKAVQIDGNGTLVFATILLWVVSFAIVLACVLVMGIAEVLENEVLIGISFILILFSEVIAMTILSHNLDGFMIAGFWSKVLLSICFALFHRITSSND